ncbi:beta-class carbonic anhydrase [Miniphocaeibacter massiliensis]|uniref:beta-class carbonic anhydrase n=1 Tax=Miniphocaeibacter massiliensis TaxID=2041841 RepID=UPI000C1B8294|nr:carbonic anhydrase [Miniphocaeibacter massiliensis]
MIEEILEYNKKFIEEKKYEDYRTDKYPNKKIAVVTCMDTRLVELLPAALGFKNGDIKLIKNAGGIITSPFGSAVRSLLIGVYKLNVENIMIIGHKECGAKIVDGKEVKELMIQRGIKPEEIETMKYCGVDVETWIGGFESTSKAVMDSVMLLREHPLMPKDVKIGGYIMDPVTGEIETIVEADI